MHRTEIHVKPFLCNGLFAKMERECVPVSGECVNLHAVSDALVLAASHFVFRLPLEPRGLLIDGALWPWDPRLFPSKVRPATEIVHFEVGTIPFRWRDHERILAGNKCTKGLVGLVLVRSHAAEDKIIAIKNALRSMIHGIISTMYEEEIDKVETKMRQEMR